MPCLGDPGALAITDASGTDVGFRGQVGAAGTTRENSEPEAPSSEISVSAPALGNNSVRFGLAHVIAPPRRNSAFHNIALAVRVRF